MVRVDWCFRIDTACPILSEKFGYPWTNGTHILRLLQHLHINIFQWYSIVTMASHKAAFDAGEVKRLVILVVVIFGAEVFIPVAGHILLEESYKVFEEFEADDDESSVISRCRKCR